MMIPAECQKKRPSATTSWHDRRAEASAHVLQIVPRDVQKDVLAFAEEFVSDLSLHAISVLDFKEALSSSLGDQ
jgi:hypothetical protein